MNFGCRGQHRYTVFVLVLYGQVGQADVLWATGLSMNNLHYKCTTILQQEALMNGCWNAGAKMAAGISAVRISCGASDNLIKIKLEIISILLGRERGFYG